MAFGKKAFGYLRRRALGPGEDEHGVEILHLEDADEGFQFFVAAALEEALTNVRGGGRL